MIRKYDITWYPTKDRENFTRVSHIKLSKPSGKTALDAKAALGIFVAQLGGLQKNTIVKIQEFDENGQLGEDIIPMAETNIIPSGR